MGNSGNRRPDSAYVSGQGTEDKTSGDHITQMPMSRARLGKSEEHAMKGILGHLRGETYTPSGYSSGDKGGSAGGYGLHGAAGAAGGSARPGMPEHKYGGAELGFEGGVRGGGDFETMPGSYPYPKKRGFDEHNQVGGVIGGGIHGIPGVDGMVDAKGQSVDGTPGGISPHGLGEGTELSGDSDGPMDGFACPHGCGQTMRSKHGLARHVFHRHGKFKGLGHSLGATTHGDAYEPPNKEFPGETEGTPEMKKIVGEFAKAKSMIGNEPSASSFSSYGRGDGGGAYGGLKLGK